MDVRDHILDATIRVFAEAGTRGATTRRIAQEAGCNEVTLFRQFGSKENLMQEALRQASLHAPAAPLPAVPADPEAELTVWARQQLDDLYRHRALLRASLGAFEEHPEMCGFICEGSLRVAHELSAYVERLHAHGLADAPEDVRAAASLLMGALFSDAVSRDIMPERYPYPVQEAAARYVRLFLRALGGRPAAGAAG